MVPKSLPVSILKPVEAPVTAVTPIPVPVATPTPQPVYTPPPQPTPAPAPPVLDSNSDKLFIYMHESGNRTSAINPNSGACGLGQALPCSKMPCSLQDYPCQDQFFTNYAINRYGSWAGAAAFWRSHSWW